MRMRLWRAAEGGSIAPTRLLDRSNLNFDDRETFFGSDLLAAHCWRRVAEVGRKKSFQIIEVEVGPIEWVDVGTGTTLGRSPKPRSHAQPAGTIVLEPFGRVPGEV